MVYFSFPYFAGLNKLLFIPYLSLVNMEVLELSKALTSTIFFLFPMSDTYIPNISSLWYTISHLSHSIHASFCILEQEPYNLLSCPLHLLLPLPSETFELYGHTHPATSRFCWDNLESVSIHVLQESFISSYIIKKYAMYVCVCVCA